MLSRTCRSCVATFGQAYASPVAIVIGLDVGVRNPEGRGALVIDGHQPALPGGAEPHALPRLGPVADGGEHLWPGQHQLDRAIHDPRRERSQDHVRPGAESGPEPAAEVRDQHPHVALRYAEHGREGLAHHHRPLGRVVHRQPVAFPAGDGGEQSERVVGLRRDGERLVVDHVGGSQRGVDIAALHLQPPRIAQYRRLGIVDAEDRSRLLVVDLDEPRRGGCLLVRLRHHDRHVLAVVQDAVVLERERRRRAEHRRRSLRESRRVLVGDHGQDARRGLRRSGVDRR